LNFSLIMLYVTPKIPASKRQYWEASAVAQRACSVHPSVPLRSPHLLQPGQGQTHSVPCSHHTGGVLRGTGPESCHATEHRSAWLEILRSSTLLSSNCQHWPQVQLHTFRVCHTLLWLFG